MYKVKRCIRCGKIVHVHKKDRHYIIKSQCEHMQDTIGKNLSESQLRGYIKGIGY